MKLYGIRDASDILFKEIETKKPVLFIDYANKAGVNVDSSTVYAKAKGSNRISWKGETTGTLTLETQLVDTKLLALMLGSEIVTTQKNVAFKEKVKITETTVTLSNTPVEGSVSVMAVEGDREFLNVGSAADATTVQVSGKTVTFDDSHVGKTYYIFGLNQEAQAKSFKVNVNNSSKAYEVTMYTEITMDSDNSKKFAQLDLFKVKPKESAGFEFDAENPTTFSLEFDVLQDASGDLLEMIELS